RVTQQATAADIFVLKNTRPAVSISASLSMPTVDAPLKPNQQNQRMKTPSAAKVMLCPSIARGLPSLSYLPIRGPKIFAPTSAQIPPTICTAVEPAKSWKPSCASQPPPQIQ